VRVSLHVMTMQPIDLGASALCSWWGAWLFILRGRKAFSTQLSAWLLL